MASCRRRSASFANRSPILCAGTPAWISYEGTFFVTTEPAPMIAPRPILTPAIFSQECNFSELAAQGAGIIPRGFDATLWGDAIDKICLDRPYYEKMKKAAERLRPQYTWKEISTRWQLLYDITANARA